MKIHAAMITIALGLGGCAHETGLPDFYAEGTEAKFGQAVRQNIAAQTVNPNAPEGTLTASGARTAKAIERYEDDKVEKPREASTLRATRPTEDSGGGSGGSNE